MTDHIGSLASLAEQSIQRLGRLVFLPVFNDFGEVLQQLSVAALPPSAATTATTGSVAAVMSSTVAARSLLQHLDTAVARLRNFKEAEQQPQLTRPNWVFKLVLDSMIEPSQTEFPGPMCCPLTRSHLDAVRRPEAKYLVCEKSDGLRAIMVSVQLPRLPRWFEIGDVSNDTESPLRPKMNLRDIAVLESALGRLLSGVSTTSSLSSAPHFQQPQQQMQALRLQLSIGEGTLQLHEYRDDLFWFEPPPNLAVGGSNRHKSLLRRVQNPADPRCATFFLDRSMTAAFLLLDDLPLPLDLSVAIADGELLVPAMNSTSSGVTTTAAASNANNHNQQQQPSSSPHITTATRTSNSLIFTTFDLFSTAPSATGGSSGVALDTLKKETMSTRYRLLQDKLVAPLQKRVRDTAVSRRHPLSVNIVRKEMVPLSELPNLLRRLTRCKSSDGQHTTVMFDGVTPNDGLIFTPDKFPLIAGSRMDQFKWKWADTLSVDWVVKPLDRVPGHVPKPVWADTGDDLQRKLEEDSSASTTPAAAAANTANGSNKVKSTRDLQYVEMFWFFRRRAARHKPWEQDVFGHSFAGHGWLWNPDNLPIEPQYLRSVSGVHSTNEKANNNNNNNNPRKGAVAAAQQRDVASEGGTVVECSLVPLSADSTRQHLALNNSFVGVWRVQRVRRDKNCANAVTAVLSVVESVSENLGVVELLQELAPEAAANPRDVLHASFFGSDVEGGAESSLSVRCVNLVAPPPLPHKVEQQPVPQPQQPAAAAVVASAGSSSAARHPLETTNFVLSIVPEADLMLLRLQWRIKLATKPLVCNHRDASQCIAEYDEKNAEAYPPSSSSTAMTTTRVLRGRKLEGILTLALANDGGCIGWSETCVQAHYDARLGRWVVERILPELDNTRASDSAFCNQVMKHLLYVIGTQTFAVYSPQEQQQLELQQVRTPLPPLIHPSVPIRDTSATQNTSRHYDEIAKFFSNRMDNNNNNNNAASAATASSCDNLSGAGHVSGKGLPQRSALRKHQNWIKQVLLSRALEERGLGMTPSGEKVKATLMDLCSGRGGDLHKYAHSPLKFLLMIDASFESSVEAARRYCNIDGLSLRTDKRGVDPGIRTTFAVGDCFDDAIVSDVVRKQVERYPNIFGVAAGGNSGDDDNGGATATTVFDLVSCQFSLHYSCSSEKRLRGFLRAVASALCVGGVFFGTTVDDSELAKRRKEHQQHQQEQQQRQHQDENLDDAKATSISASFGNECYRVEFVSNETAQRMTFDEDVRSGKVPLLSEGYLMHMAECVQGALEYVVPFDTFQMIAIEEGLILVEEANFKDFFDVHRNSPLGRGAFASARMGGNRRGRDNNSNNNGGAKNEEVDHDASAGGNAADAVPIVVDFGLTEAERTAAYLYRVILLRKFR